MKHPTIYVHPSQFPAQVRRGLEDGLRAGMLPHKFHYDSYRQARAWQRLHQAYAPIQTDARCAELYRQAALETRTLLGSIDTALIGLGCGGGEKDRLLIEAFQARGNRLNYVPVDCSLPLVLSAWSCVHHPEGESNASLSRLPCIVCDLSQAGDLDVLLDAALERKGPPRLLTYFGMIPNFEPNQVVPWLARWAGPGGWLLVGANLAPGGDYQDGMRQIRPGYENELTNNWLTMLLSDLGLGPEPSQVHWSIQPCPAGSGLLRMQAEYVFDRPAEVRLEGFFRSWNAGDSLRLFYSYRHTPDRLNHVMGIAGWRQRGQWIASSEEEGVFLYQRS